MSDSRSHNSSHSASGSDGITVPKSDAERALAALLPATGKFTQRLHDAVRDRDTGWHRLNVKVAGGKIKTVQLILDEAVDLENSDEPSE